MSFDSKNAQKALSGLLRLGFEEDELETMFKTDSELIEFYKKTREAAKQKITVDADDEEDEDEPVDTFKLPADESERLLRDDKIALTAEQKAEYEKHQVINPDGAEPLVSFEEAMGAIEDLNLDDMMKELDEEDKKT